MTSHTVFTRTIAPLVALSLALIAAPRSAAAQDARPQPELRVLSFNIRFGTADDGPNAWPHRRDAVFDVLRADGTPDAPAFDLVGLQEALAFQIDEILAALPGYRAVGVGRDDGKRAGEFCAILYTPARVEVLDSGTRWLSDTPDIPGSASWGNRVTRIFTWAQCRRAGNEAPPFLVVNTHWDHQSAPSRQQSAAAIADWLTRDTRVWTPRIVVGDFNAGEASPERRWLDEDAGLRDAWRDLHKHATEPATFCGFSTADKPGPKIDAVLVSDRWEVTAADIDRRGTPEGRAPSDHFPVSAVLRLKP